MVLVVAGIIAAGGISIALTPGPHQNATTVTSSSQNADTIIQNSTTTTNTSGCAVKVDQNFTVGSRLLYEGEIAYDPTNALLYVSSPSTGSIYAISATNGSVKAKISGLGSPGDLAYDPSNGGIYYSNISSDTVSVLNTTTNAVVANITLGNGPSQLAYDPLDQEMYVSVAGTENGYSITGSGVFAISDTSNVTKISQTPFPDEIAFDAKDGFMYVANGGDNETIFNATNNLFAGMVFLPQTSGYSHVSYEPVNGNLYFANYGSNAIIVVNGTENSHPSYSILNNILTNVSIPYAPSAMASYPAGGSIWIGTNATGGILSIISGSSDTATNFHIHFTPTSFAFDATNKEMFVLSLPNQVLGLSCG